jgi:hypothetical protein
MKNVYLLFSGRIGELFYLLEIKKNYWNKKIFKINDVYKEFR